MKNKNHLFYFLIIVLLFQSCSYSISKRRYSRGFNINFGSHKTLGSTKSKKKPNSQKNHTVNLEAKKIELNTTSLAKSKIKTINNKIEYSLPQYFYSQTNSPQQFNAMLDSPQDSIENFEIAIDRANQYIKRTKNWSIGRYVGSTIVGITLALFLEFSSGSSIIFTTLPFFALGIMLFLIIAYYHNLSKSIMNIKIALNYADKNNKDQKNQLNKAIQKLNKVVQKSIIIFSVLAFLLTISVFSIEFLLLFLLIIPAMVAISKLKTAFKLKFN